MAATDYTDKNPLGVDPTSVAGTRPNVPAEGTIGGAPEDNPTADVDAKYWIRCLDDAERAEMDWRQRGRKITQVYRNEVAKSGKKGAAGRITFNILYANTEVMLPAIYAQPPEPIVRSRWTAPDKPPPPPMPPMMPPAGGPSPMGAAPLPGMLGSPPGPGGPPAAGPGSPPPAGAPIPLPPGLQAAGGPGIPSSGPAGLPGTPPPSPGGPVPPTSPGIPPMPTPQMQGSLPTGTPPTQPMGGGKPSQKDIETAASVMQKALEVVLSGEQSHESVKAAVKDVLLPGRGVCRVRWTPTMKSQPVMAGDGMTPLPGGGVTGAEPAMEEVKVWEEVSDEYVYWEDLLMDPVRAAGSTDWIAFRHLMTAQQLTREFAGNPQFDQMVAKGRLSDLCRWTEESAAKNAVGGGSATKTSDKLGDVIKKAMVWEIWDRTNRRVIWFIRDMGGLVLRVDEDTYQLTGFYPIPKPMLAVTTSDTQIPRAFYDIYEDLADDLDETSKRISRLTKQIKVRGAYNAANNEIKDILTADDQKMIPVAGIDLATRGLDAHIWLVPILQFMQALDKLIASRDVLKEVIYEVMGISDIMRGATKASETATAQRIKGSMGMVRLTDQKQQAANFVTDLLRMKGELIAQNFDAQTLALMTGEDVTPSVMAILRSDFQRTCLITIEDDSTVSPDESEEQQGMSQVMMAIGQIMQGAALMLQTQMLPAPQVALFAIEMMKMALHPIRYSRGVVELLDDFSEKLEEQIAMQAAMPPMPPGLGPPGPGAGGPPPPHPGLPPPHGAPPHALPPNGAGGPPGGLPPPAPGIPPPQLQ